MKPHYMLLFLWTVLSTLACSKTKVDDWRDPSIPLNNIKSSTARIVLVGGCDLEVNNTRLTNWEAPDITGSPQLKPLPTPYFPTTGKPGTTYYIPQEFMDASGKAMVRLYSAGGSGPLATAQVEDNYNHPWDYYYNIQDQGLFTPIPRPVIKPSTPQNILIRLVNLSSTLGLNHAPGQTLSLSYANGSKVGNATSGIARGSWSQYVEIPYGTYEFRVLVDGSAEQYPAFPPQGATTTSSTDFTLSGTNSYFTQRRVFQPGGIYTVVTFFNSDKFESGDLFVRLNLNLFTVITDLQPEANVTYARVQVANAILKSNIHVSFDSNGNESVPYGTAGNYQVLARGKHTLEIKDDAGKLLTKKEFQVKGGDNFTIWVYPQQNGSTETTIIQNNMSGIANTSANPDGADGSSSVNDPLRTNAMNIQTRFLNFCPEFEAVSFTGANGQPLVSLSGSTGYPAATINLKTGQAPDEKLLPFPYINIIPNSIEVYQSQPGSVPGNRLFGVTPLTAGNFINMPETFYPNGLPKGEAGVYTVALIGHNNDNEQPRLFVIKHNQ